MMAPQTIEASLGHDCVGRVHFFAWQDRIAHSVEIQQNGSSQIWESVEGDDQQDWPPSPPFQNLSIQRIRESDVALLVGMAGKSHWSLSVDIDAERGSIRFDVACRIAEPSDQLGSQYRTPAQVNISSPDQGAELTVAGRRCQLVLESTGRGESDLLEFNKGLLRIVATQQLATYPDTLRWKYSLLG